MDRLKDWLLNDDTFEAFMWTMALIVIANVLAAVVVTVVVVAVETSILVLYGFWAVVGFYMFRFFRRNLERIKDD